MPSHWSLLDIAGFLGGAPTSMCHFFRPSICPSVCPSVVQHISGTVHHLIIIFGTLM